MKAHRIGRLIYRNQLALAKMTEEQNDLVSIMVEVASESLTYAGELSHTEEVIPLDDYNAIIDELSQVEAALESSIKRNRELLDLLRSLPEMIA